LREPLARCGTIAASLFTHLDFTKGIALSTSVNRLDHTHISLELFVYRASKLHTILTVVPKARLLEKVFKD
jgi:hypothetical protein